MKDIKSFIIGFLSCACFLLIMGQTDEENFTMSVLDGDITISDEFGQYQAFELNYHLHLVFSCFYRKY